MAAAPAPQPAGSARPARRPEVDAVRGLVMIVMALDHVRDFLGNAHFDATDLARTTAPLFATRWITHFCAPTFFLLAGMSAYLSIQSGRRTAAAAARFLVVRGLALVVLEQTALRCLGWYFHFDYHFMNAGVLYGLGWSMVLLAGMVVLPPAASLAAGLVIVLGEPAIAAIDPGDGPLGTLWALATRSRDFEPVAGYHFFVSYPPIPWFGAMALGHGLAALAHGGGAPRRGLLAGFAAACLALFAILRALNLGDPSPWSAQPRGLFTALSFLDLSKYPPSTPYLLLTLGGALLGLAALGRSPGPYPGPARRVLETFGRVPLFFYVLHIPLIHAIAVAYSYLAFGAATWLTSGPVIFWDVALPAARRATASRCPASMRSGSPSSSRCTRPAAGTALGDRARSHRLSRRFRCSCSRTAQSMSEIGRCPRCHTPEPDGSHEVWGGTLVNVGLLCKMTM